MVIEEALQAYLLTQASLIALTSNRIYFLKLPQEPKLPAITIQKISTSHLHGFSADYGATSRIQINCWATTYTNASAVYEQLRTALQNYRNTTMGSVSVSWIELDDENDVYEDDTQRFGKQMDIIIWYTE